MPPAKEYIWQQFDRSSEGVHKLARATCKHCKHTFVGQANRAEKHLARCGPYQLFLSAADKASASEPVEPYHHRYSSFDQQAHDKRLGMAIFAGGLPLHTFDKWRCSQMWTFIHELNRAYQIPERHTLVNDILPICHKDIKEKVQDRLSTVQYLNFVTDASDDEANRQICNLSVIAPAQGLFFIKNYWTQAQRQPAGPLADIIMPGIEEACNQDPSRINSIAMDSCSTMRSLTKISQSPQYSHIFFVLCDSHGIQLLIKAIMHLPCFASILHKAQTILATFKKSRLQLAILRGIQQQMYGRTFALISPVLTHWHSQYGIFYSLLRSRDALLMYSRHDRAALKDRKADIKHWLHDPNMWRDFERMEELLRPLHEAQKMSESDGAHVGLVTKRWLDIKGDLQRLFDSGRFPDLESVISSTGVWTTLYNQQITSIHLTAFYLDPQNIDMTMTQYTTDRVFRFMRQYIDPNYSEERWKKTLADFLAFRNQQHPFDLNARGDIWVPAIVAKPISFWLRNRQRAEELATFALRIFNTPANSAPAERSFSAVDYNLHRDRTKLSAEQNDQSAYIYMNQRALRKVNEVDPKDWSSLSDDDAVSIEDDMLALLDREESLDDGTMSAQQQTGDDGPLEGLLGPPIEAYNT